MAVEVRVPTILRTHTDGERSVEGKAGTIREMLDDLDSRHPGLRDAITTPDGELHRFLNMYLNDEDVRFMGGLETPASDGDVISILPAVAGG